MTVLKTLCERMVCPSGHPWRSLLRGRACLSSASDVNVDSHPDVHSDEQVGKVTSHQDGMPFASEPERDWNLAGEILAQAYMQLSSPSGALVRSPTGSLLAVGFTETLEAHNMKKYLQRILPRRPKKPKRVYQYVWMGQPEGGYVLAKRRANGRPNMPWRVFQ